MAEEKQEVAKVHKGVKKRTKVVKTQKEAQKAIQDSRLKPTELNPFPAQPKKK